jgi:hypothetical protein
LSGAFWETAERLGTPPMSEKEDIKDQIEELEQSLRSIEKEVDAAITLASRKAIASRLEQGFG